MTVGELLIRCSQQAFVLDSPESSHVRSLLLPCSGTAVGERDLVSQRLEDVSIAVGLAFCAWLEGLLWTLFLAVVETQGSSERARLIPRPLFSGDSTGSGSSVSGVPSSKMLPTSSGWQGLGQSCGFLPSICGVECPLKHLEAAALSMRGDENGDALGKGFLRIDVGDLFPGRVIVFLLIACDRVKDGGFASGTCSVGWSC